MNRIVSAFFALFVSAFAVAAPPLPDTSSAKDDLSMIFEAIPLRQLLLLHYDVCLKRGFVIDPNLSAQLDSSVTLKMSGTKCQAVASAIDQVLLKVKLTAVHFPAYDLITAIQAGDERDSYKELVYLPRYRDAVSLGELCQIVIRKGSFAHQRAGRPAVSNQAGTSATAESSKAAESGFNGASLTGKAVDRLVFYGPESEVKALSALLPKLDLPSAQLEIRVGVYEFSSQSDQGSAVSAALKLFSGRFSVGTGPSAAGTVLKITTGSIEAALDLLDSDSRFKYVARPKVLVRDGQSARFFSGEDVRVVGATVLDNKGNPIQSRETLSAGVTLEVTPRIYADSVSIDLFQSVSSFSASSGSDPTVNKREVRTSLTVDPGATVYVIGGLQSGRKTVSKSRFFGWRMSDTDASADTEVILLLSVSRDTPDGPARRSAETVGGSAS